MPLAVVAAVVGAAGAVGGALISSHATSSAASTAANTAAADNALQLQIYNSNKAELQPYVDRGNTAGDELNGFLGLGGNPAAINSAFQTYLNSTGYQFTLNQGEQNTEQAGEKLGIAQSGGELKALDAYNTGEAQQYGQQYAGDLQGVVNTGAGSASALAGTGQNFANASNSNSNSAANVAAAADIANANNSTSAINNAVNAFAKVAGSSSFGNPSSSGGSNAFAPAGVFDI